MVNKSKRKGTRNENRLGALLATVWTTPTHVVERTAPGTPGRDFTGTGNVSVEAKKRQRWDIPAWARQQVELGHERWAIFVSPADARKADAPPAVMVVPEEFGIELLRAAKFLGVIL